jgi:uncharacterized protein
MEGTGRKVVILGASNKPDRYAYLALNRLMQRGYDVIPVHPVIKEINGISVVKSLAEVDGEIDTVTLYVGSSRVNELINEITALKPLRIIANPGTESSLLAKKAAENNIGYVEGCTLVMLSTGEF